jgi:hypothetical protein
VSAEVVVETQQSERPIWVGAAIGIVVGVLLVVLIAVTGIFDHT